MPNIDDEMTSELIKLLAEKNNGLKQKLADYKVANIHGLLSSVLTLLSTT